MFARRVMLMIVFALAIADPASADELQLSDRLTVPQQGHLELQRAIIADLDGVQLETVPDVVKLRDQLEGIAYDREAVLKWKFLDQLGFTVVKHEIPPSPPGVKIELIQGPAWTTTVYDYTTDTFVDRTSYDTTLHTYARSPVSEVFVLQNGDEQSITHGATLAERPDRFVPGEVFARTRRSLKGPYAQREAAGQTFHVAESTKYENWLLVDLDRDAILATAMVDRKTNQLLSCSLYLYLQPSSATCRFPMPRLVLHFNLLADDACYVTMYHLDRADFEATINPQQLQVPVKQGALYTSKSEGGEFQKRLPNDIDDILNLFPETVQEMIGKP